MLISVSREPHVSLLTMIDRAAMTVNQDYARKFGRVSMGRLIGPDGNELHTGLIIGKSVGSMTRNRYTAQVKLSALTGSPASRLSASGRRGPWVCWYTFRDFFRAFYSEVEDARIRTMYATYESAENFEEKFPATWRTRTSDYGPFFGELCHELGWHDQHDRK